jgi:hypothetical protein
MFFNAKKEESSANALFRKHCTYHGLSIQLSLHSLAGLKTIAENKEATEDMIGERVTYVLHRRGFVRRTADDAIVLTEAGLLVLALAEAGNLITIKAPK